MKKKLKNKLAEYRSLAILVLVILAGAGIAVGKAADDGKQASVVIENQTVQGNFVAQAAVGEPNLIADQDLGIANPQEPTSDFLNLRVHGPFQTCEGETSTLCYVRVTETKQWDKTTTTLFFTNGRSTSSTLSRLVFDMTNAGTTAVASGTMMISCGTSTSQFVIYNASNTPNSIWNDVVIPTSTQVVLDSAIYSSGTTPVAALIGQMGATIVPPQGKIACILQVPVTNSCNPTVGTGVSCEQVTSTQSNWAAKVMATWNWFASSSQNF